jgi:hypothetical protein
MSLFERKIRPAYVTAPVEPPVPVEVRIADLHDALRRAADLEQVREELRIARFGNERDLADIQDLTSERDALVKALATANHQNRLLAAELGSALRRLNEKEGKS